MPRANAERLQRRCAGAPLGVPGWWPRPRRAFLGTVPSEEGFLRANQHVPMSRSRTMYPIWPGVARPDGRAARVAQRAVNEILDRVRSDGQRMFLRHRRPRRRPAGAALPARPRRPLRGPLVQRGLRDRAPRLRCARPGPVRRDHGDRRPGRPRPAVPGHQARRRPAHVASAGRRRGRCRPPQREVAAAAHPDPGPVQERAGHLAGSDERRRTRPARRRPRPRGQRSPRPPTRGTICTARAARPGSAAPASS